jgi:hypothetical protein
MSDPSRGVQGSRPSWTLAGAHGEERFGETWDFAGAEAAARAAGCTTDPQAAALQNPAVKANSYLYEFCCAKCSWWTGGMYPDPGNQAQFYDASDAKVDADKDGKISWREAREFEMNTAGLQQTPIVSCWWHTKDAKEVLRAGAGNKNVYTSDVTWDGWKTLSR